MAYKREPKSIEQLFSQTVLTTGDVAQLCRVSSRTVTGWLEQGKLKGHVIPSGAKNPHRRVDLAELLRFMELHRFPIPEAAKICDVASKIKDANYERLEQLIKIAWDALGIGNCTVSLQDKSVKIDHARREQFLQAYEDWKVATGEINAIKRDKLRALIRRTTASRGSRTVPGRGAECQSISESHRHFDRNESGADSPSQSQERGDK
jgi:hypothetical protein